MFSNANDFKIEGGHFGIVHGNQHNKNQNRSKTITNSNNTYGDTFHNSHVGRISRDTYNYGSDAARFSSALHYPAPHTESPPYTQAIPVPWAGTPRRRSPYPQSDESDDSDAQPRFRSRNPYRTSHEMPSHQPHGLYDDELHRTAQPSSPEVLPLVDDIRFTAGAPEHVEVHDETTPSEVDRNETGDSPFGHEPHDLFQQRDLFLDDNQSIASDRPVPETPREPSARHNSPLPNDWEYAPSDTTSLRGPPSESHWDADDEYDDTLSERGPISIKRSDSVIRAQAHIQRFVEMGFSRRDVLRCMTASNNYPDLALEYLLEGIPSGLGRRHHY